MTASFFDYDPSIGGYRYITLTEDSPRVESSHGGEHEEGWSRTDTIWELDGDVVVCTVYDDGRDCDGRLSTTTVVVCPVSDLAACDVYTDGDAEASASGPLPFRVPAWRERSRGQRDYSAERAGY